MRVRFGILAAVLTIGLSPLLAACGGSDDGKDSDAKSPSASSTRLATPSDDLTEITVPCEKFGAAAAKIAEAQRDLYSGGTPGAIKALTAQLQGLKDGAPAEVKSAIDDLVDAFGTVAEMLENPTEQARTELAKIGPELAEAGQKLSAYITSKCG